jgi:hypothetical protein
MGLEPFEPEAVTKWDNAIDHLSQELRDDFLYGLILLAMGIMMLVLTVLKGARRESLFLLKYLEK